jgi:DHA1 family bicyclomycin/chloramphenicol resistance-like MFS transporter
LLVFIAFSGTLAMHIFVPALPKAAQALQTDSHTIQLAITVYILGLALGQLIYGPLSDSIGRRKAVIGGLVLYSAGAIASGLAPNAEFLIIARLLQALGGAGGLSLTRVIVADTRKGTEATKGIAVLNLILLLGPGLAPVIGAQIADHFGWRVIFAALTVMAVVTLFFTLFKLPETRDLSHITSPGQAFRGFANLARNRAFFRIASGGAFGSTACYAYFVSAPFILSDDMGLSVQMVGYCIGGTLIAAAAGTLLTRSLVGKVKTRTLLVAFSSLGLAAGALFLAAALAHLLTPVAVVALSLLVLFSAGGLGPVTIGTILQLAGPEAGSAAGLYGCVQMLSGVVCSFIAGLFTNHAMGCGLVLTGGYLICLIQSLQWPRKTPERA